MRYLLIAFFLLWSPAPGSSQTHHSFNFDGAGRQVERWTAHGLPARGEFSATVRLADAPDPQQPSVLIFALFNEGQPSRLVSINFAFSSGERLRAPTVDLMDKRVTLPGDIAVERPFAFQLKWGNGVLAASIDGAVETAFELPFTPTDIAIGGLSVDGRFTEVRIRALPGR